MFRIKHLNFDNNFITCVSLYTEIVVRLYYDTYMSRIKYLYETHCTMYVYATRILVNKKLLHASLVLQV